MFYKGNSQQIQRLMRMGAGCALCYRHEYRIERIFNRLQSRVHIAPLFVKLNDQIEGLTYLLTLGVRVLTVMEFVLRRSLQTDQTKLPGLHPEHKRHYPQYWGFEIHSKILYRNVVLKLCRPQA